MDTRRYSEHKGDIISLASGLTLNPLEGDFFCKQIEAPCQGGWGLKNIEMWY